ncbi:hypothetical protein ACHAWF_006239 [Thalassiosira exigua]
MTAPPSGAAADAAHPPASSAGTTRTCIKNLPPHFSEAALKSHLLASRPSLSITDCRLLKTKDGRSRKIAFVGLRTAEEAEAVVRYFDRTFIGTSRLHASLAFSKKRGPPRGGGEGGTEEFRPWSKHSAGSSGYEKRRRKRGGEDVDVAADERGDGKGEGGAKEPGDDGAGRAGAGAGAGTSDRKRDEFLSAMGVPSSAKTEGGEKASKSKFWANDDAVAAPAVGKTTTVGPTDGSSRNGEGGDEGDGGRSGGSSDSDSDSDSEDEGGDADNAKRAAGSAGSAGAGKGGSDLDFLKSKQVNADILSDDEESKGSKDRDDSDDSSTSSDSSSGSDGTDEDDKADAAAGEGKVENSKPSTGAGDDDGTDGSPKAQPSESLGDRLFVRNLPFAAAEEDLAELFSRFGDVASVHIPVDDAKRNKGYAFVAFERQKDARAAMEAMDGEDFQGRLIHILPARPSVDQTRGEDGRNLTYKERQDLARRNEAEKAKGWSASFLRGDAVADNLSHRLGVSKGEVLDVKDGISSGNAAVRLALGETHLIAENVAFFEEHGVDVSALESNESNRSKGKTSGKMAGGKVERSKTKILVKNLPYDTTREDLAKVFHGIGGDAPTNILLPPSKTAALVEYGHASDARRALRRLAYKKFKHVPLYLEWAPVLAGARKEGAATERSKEGSNDASEEGGAANERGGDEAAAKGGSADEDPAADAVDAGASRTLYVKNLSFATSEDRLAKAFEKAGFRPRAAKIPTKAAPSKKRDGDNDKDERQLSMGFGFVEYATEEEAVKAMRSLNGTLVDGHALETKLSTKSLSSSKAPKAPEEDKASLNTKIMVRNVPFEATRTELLRLFGTFGQLKRVRLPKKFDGTHRGFAFCEFVTNKEARNAMTALSRTHLYGRRLVLEWAAPEDGRNENVEKVREKARRDATRAGLGSAGGPRKRNKHLKF